MAGVRFDGEQQGVDGQGRVFGSVSLAHQTCLALEFVLLDTLHDIQPMAPISHARTPSNTTATDTDNPQSMVITSLRGQVSDLVSQVTQLNSKLVQSYDRISDLEDNIHLTSSNLRNSTLKISQLELERTQHLSALNTGLLVEKSHVTTELTRLMEKATDEAARRGKAESARQEIEKDLDDLSAELFDRANTMVAEARFEQAKSERRTQDAEAMLKGAEEAVASMQAQMQTLRDDKDRTDRELDKGKWVEREKPLRSPAPPKLLSSHVPYQEFLLFVAHLRQIRPATPQLPPMTTLLPLPFLTRLVSEDSDPTLRLDSAPSLNWLTRRSVISAIHQSQLTVEPLSITALLEAFSPPAYSASQQQPTISVPCALCGKSVLPASYTTSANAHGSPPLNGTSNAWRPAFLARQSSSGTPTRQNSPAIHSPTPSVATSTSFYAPSSTSTRLSPPPTPPLPSPVSLVYIFRLLPPSSQPSQTQTTTVYPLCTTGWCLARLRTTCELWRFVRTGIIDKVWDEEYSTLGPTSPRSAAQNGPMVPAMNGKPPIPPRRRLPTSVNVGMGKLFGMASSALGKASGTPPKQNETGTAPLFPTKANVPPPLPKRNNSRNERADEARRRDTTEIEKKADVSTESTPATEDTKPIDLAPAAVNGMVPLPTESQDDLHTPRRSSFGPTQGAEPVQEGQIEPSQIPLPESPVASSFTVHEDTLHRQESEDAAVLPTEMPAEDSAAPTPSAHAASPDLEGEPQARTVSPSQIASPAPPAPPPLPRRAARRTAPVPAGETPSPSSNLDDQRRRASSVSDGHESSPRRTSVSNSNTNGDEPEVYIGDATWEERTWKVLVRLREDMFYARLGSVR
ncbi:hypothetical protein JB92DRAFT_1945332 [Gautieria morchelliformis]|nr:hypothetical protein JB92DRAFT_1945332 [Gautieria morchelliformis]